MSDPRPDAAAAGAPEPDPDKRYYSISEVAERLGVKASVLRYWEGEFPALQPKKTRTGRRLYSARDLTLLQQIVHLTRERRYTIEGARAALRHEREALAETHELRHTLESLRAALLRWREQL